MTKDKPLRFANIDAGLDMAINDLRSYCRHLRRGRILLVLDRVDGYTADYRIERDALTSEDLQRIMQEPPRRGGGG